MIPYEFKTPILGKTEEEDRGDFNFTGLLCELYSTQSMHYKYPFLLFYTDKDWTKHVVKREADLVT